MQTWALFCALFLAATPLPAELYNLTDAPFTATMVETRDGQITNTTALARASNGSTYVALSRRDGRLISVTIEDVRNARTIILHPNPPSYTYQLLPRPDGKIRTFTVEENRAMLQQMEDSFVERPDRDQANGVHHQQTALRTRQEDGMILFGSRDEVTLASGAKRTLEIWQSDLGFTAKLIDSDTPTGVNVSSVTNVFRVEPDPKLFEIPAEYLPHPDPLLDGRKVFIDNQTGVPEVKDAAIATFPAAGPWAGRWSPTDLLQDADLVFTFVNVAPVRTDGLDSPFEMRVHVPHSDTVLFVTRPLRRPGLPAPTHPSYEKSFAAGCVINLLNQVMNTHIGQVQTHPVSMGPSAH